MTGFYPYLIKSVFALSALYIFYWTLLRKETFYRFNRAFFLSAILLIVILPVINLGFIKAVQTGSPAQVINSGYQYIQNAILLNTADTEFAQSSRLGLTDLIITVYWSGVILLTIRMIYQTGLVIFLISRSRILKIDGLNIVPNGRFSVPFAFFSYVFLPQDLLNESSIKAIIIHEKEHIKQVHWIDLILMEIVCVLQWFNPFVWFFRWSVKETHEFLADQGAIRQGLSKPTYLRLLLEYVLGTPGIGLTHSFNYSLSKKRIQMMKKEKSPNRRKLRIFIILPVILILSMAFSTTVQDMGSNLFSNLAIQDQGIKVNGKIVAKDTGKPLSGAHIIIKGTSNGTSSDEDGKFQIDVPGKRNVLMISYVGYETAAILVEKGNYDKIMMERTSYEIELEDYIEVGVDIVMDEVELYEAVEIGVEEVEIADEAVEIKIGIKMDELKEGVEIEVEEIEEFDEAVEVELDMKMDELIEEVEIEAISEVEPVEEVYIVVEDLPGFPGGKEALAKFISKHIKYPEDALKAGKSGTVYVNIRINEKGEIEEAKVKKSVFPSLDEEALRVVKEMPKWIPGKQDGKPVNCDVVLPIEFKMQ